jgi:nicotinamide-nucleotide amidase
MRVTAGAGQTRHMSDSTDLATSLAERAHRHRFTVAVAESLTGGTIATRLGAAPDSSAWFRGSLVASAPEVKFEVLGVSPGPVVTEDCARAMAAGVANLLDADLAVAVTGVGGPDDEEGHPAGTVWFSVVSPSGQRAELRRFEGEPEEILAATTEHALRLLLAAAPGSG